MKVYVERAYNDHLSVNDVIGYLSASESPLAGKTWRLVLTAGGRTYPGVTRNGNPPIEISCREAEGHAITTGTGCHDTLASAYASTGDFPGFKLPQSLTSGTELCIAEQVESAGTWHTMTTPARACSTVS